MSYQKDRDAFVFQCAKEGLDLTFAQYAMKRAEVLQRLAIAECNRELTVTERSYQERMEQQLAQACAAFRVRPDVSGDPRGYVVKLHFPSGAYNTWGGKESGYGVPTRCH